MATPSSAGRSGAAASAARSGGDCRCACGNLLARLTPRGIEVKCRRCKRVVVLAVPGGGDAAPAPATARAPPAPPQQRT